jgi:hypothetical protein
MKLGFLNVREEKIMIPIQKWLGKVYEEHLFVVVGGILFRFFLTCVLLYLCT